MSKNKRMFYQFSLFNQESLFMSNIEVKQLLIKPNPLKQYLIKKLQAKKYMSYSEFFHEALTNKEYGYYMNQNMLSKDGDFITSPEISQLFSEQIAIWHIMLWEKTQALDKEKIYVEIGPGSGKLSIVVTHTFHQFGLLKNLQMNLVEVSPFLRKIQQEKFIEFFIKKNIHFEQIENEQKETYYSSELNFSIVWHKSVLEGLTYFKNQKVPIHFVAHEFFDALPSFKFVFKNGLWYEKVIGLDEIIHSSEEAQDSNKDGKIKTFKETLSIPYNTSVKKILNPQV